MQNFITFDKYNLLFTMSLAVLIQMSFFVIAAYFKTDKVTDLSYGLSFVIISLFLILLRKNFNLITILPTIMVILWGFRLAGYLFIRILKIKKDKRFDDIRESFIKFALFWFFQGISVWVILLPLIIFLSIRLPKYKFNIISLFGFFIWMAGLTIETIADIQKFKFKGKTKNKNKWIETGLWKYSRHPNYFGEMLCWWGIYIYILPFLSGVLYLTIVSPIYISYLLLFVTGIPTLEEKYEKKFSNNPKFKEYKAKTSLLIPLPKIKD